MAQHLPPDILFHIFTNYSSPDQYLNGLMLICRNWYEITRFEMFWLATLKNALKQQIDECKNHENLETLIKHDTQNNLVIKLSDILKERQTYVSSLVMREKILIINMKPFTKRRETNDDIYGNSYKYKTVQFIRERRKRMVVLEIVKPAIEFNENEDVNFFKKKWEQIIHNIQFNQYYDKKVIAKLAIFNSCETIFHIFLKQCQLYFGSELLLDGIVSFFIYDCGLSVCSYVERLIKAKFHESFLKTRENKITIFEMLKSEVQYTGKAGVPSQTLSYLVSYANLSDSLHIELIRKFIELFKSKRLLKFKENMVEPYLSDYYRNLIVDWQVIELFLKDMNMVGCKGFDHNQFIVMLLKQLHLFSPWDGQKVIEILQRSNKEFGLRLDIPIPFILTTSPIYFSILKLLVENGSDVNSSPILPVDANFDFGVPLARIIYHSTNDSRSDEIRYLLEHGATLPDKDTEMPTNFYYLYTYANIFEFYCDFDGDYIQTLKLLVEKCGQRISRAKYILKKINRNLTSLKMTVSQFCEILGYFKEINILDKESDTKYLSLIYCNWDQCSAESDPHSAEVLREFIEKVLGFELNQELIDLNTMQRLNY